MRPSENPLVKARAVETRSPHNRLVAMLLCLFLGIFGVHRFYVGKTGTGIAMAVLAIFTAGTVPFIWAIIDFIFLITGRFRDAQNRVLGPPKLEYDQLPSPNEQRERERRRKVLESQPEPELAPLPNDEPEMDDEIMRDPLEDEFDKLEQEMQSKSG